MTLQCQHVISRELFDIQAKTLLCHEYAAITTGKMSEIDVLYC